MTDTIEALRTLLPLIGLHRELMPGARTVARYGYATVEPGPPPPAWATYDCDGHCPRCDYDPATATGPDRCGGEAWERMECYLRRAYRIDEVARVYAALEHECPWMHRAVRLVYVEPWADERSEPISEGARAMRRRVAEDGIEWMAARVRGDLVEFGERPMSRAERARIRREQIARMLAKGESYRRIQYVLEVSSRTIAAVARSMSTPVEYSVR